MGRKLSRKEVAIPGEEVEETDDDHSCDYQEVMEAGLKIPKDFISEMTEAFSLFDKVYLYTV